MLLLRMIQGLSVGGGRLRLDPLKCEDIPPANAWFLAKGDPICFAIRHAMVLLPIVFYSGITPLLHPLFPGGIAMRQFLLLSQPRGGRGRRHRLTAVYLAQGSEGLAQWADSLPADAGRSQRSGPGLPAPGIYASRNRTEQAACPRNSPIAPMNWPLLAGQRKT